jgi:hypothetical protein
MKGDIMTPEERKVRDAKNHKIWCAKNKEHRAEYHRKRNAGRKKEKAEYDAEYYKENTQKVLNRAKKWKQDNPDKVSESCKKYRNKEKEYWDTRQAEYYMKTKYGMTMDDYHRMLKEQGDKCDICGISVEDYKKKSRIRFHIDHCHTTGLVRGILCGPCNTGLGSFKDSTTSLSNSITYLKKKPNCKGNNGEN